MTSEATDPEVRLDGSMHDCRNVKVLSSDSKQSISTSIAYSQRGSLCDDGALLTRCQGLDRQANVRGSLREDAEMPAQTSRNTKSYQMFIREKNIILLRIDTDSILLLVLIIILIRLKVQRIAIVELLILATLLGSLVR